MHSLFIIIKRVIRNDLEYHNIKCIGQICGRDRFSLISNHKIMQSENVTMWINQKQNTWLTI
jgi:hypothetical protein